MAAKTKTAAKKTVVKKTVVKKTVVKKTVVKKTAVSKSKGKSLGTGSYDVLLARALAYPGTREDHPWGETVVKVGKKVFVFLWRDPGVWSGTFKLPSSSSAALTFPFASPTGYGLGKAGWITARFPDGDAGPLPLLLEWLDESYRAIAPAKLVKELDARAQSSARAG